MKKIHFIDCGANIGQSIEWALDNFKSHSLRIDSFEPLPANYNILLEKFSKNQNVSLHNVAVSVTDSFEKFYCQNWGARTGSSLIKGKSSTSDTDCINVKTIDLANWIKSNVDQDDEVILKIDIEGKEYDLIPHLLQQSIDTISSVWFIEFHGNKTRNYNQKVEADVKKRVKVFDWSKPDQVSNEIKKLGLFT